MLSESQKADFEAVGRSIVSKCHDKQALHAAEVYYFDARPGNLSNDSSEELTWALKQRGINLHVEIVSAHVRPDFKSAAQTPDLLVVVVHSGRLDIKHDLRLDAGLRSQFGKLVHHLEIEMVPFRGFALAGVKAPSYDA